MLPTYLSERTSRIEQTRGIPRLPADRASGAWRDRLQIGEGAHDQLGEALRKLWRTIRSRLPSLLGIALLPQSLQGQLPCKNCQGPRAHKKVARLAVLGPRQSAGSVPSGPIAEIVWVVERARCFVPKGLSRDHLGWLSPKATVGCDRDRCRQAVLIVPHPLHTSHQISTSDIYLVRTLFACCAVPKWCSDQKASSDQRSS